MRNLSRGILQFFEFLFAGKKIGEDSSILARILYNDVMEASENQPADSGPALGGFVCLH